MADGCMKTFSDCSGIGCCIPEGDFKKIQLSEVVQNDERNCTDVPCLLAMIIAIVVQIYLISYAADKGADPDTLLHGYDYQGKWCDKNHADGKLNAWVNIAESYTFRICVQSCSETSNNNNSRMVLAYNSDEFLNAYCIPENVDDFDAFSQFGDYSAEMQRGVSDINTSKWMILLSAFIAMLFGFFYLRVIEWIGGIIIWSTIILFFIGGIIGSSFLIYDGISNYNNDESNYTAQAELAIGIVILILLFCLFCAMFWIKKRIDLALIMLDEGK